MASAKIASTAETFESGIAGLLGHRDPDVRASALELLEQVVTGELLAAGRADNPAARATLAGHVRLLERALGEGEGAGDVRRHLRELVRARLAKNGAGLDDPFLVVLENYLDALRAPGVLPPARS